jgi:transcriptional regulator with XRE-family HTH domain
MRRQRIETLGRGLREMAGILDIAPAHLTDIEKSRRTPSEDLLLRIAKHYRLSVATLRSGWNRPDARVAAVANLDETTADRVPKFLEQAQTLSPQQWDRLIEHARRLAADEANSHG